MKQETTPLSCSQTAKILKINKMNSICFDKLELNYRLIIYSFLTLNSLMKTTAVITKTDRSCLSDKDFQKDFCGNQHTIPQRVMRIKNF